MLSFRSHPRMTVLPTMWGKFFNVVSLPIVVLLAALKVC